MTLRELFGKSEYAGFQVIVNATPPFKRSLLKMGDFGFQEIEKGRLKPGDLVTAGLLKSLTSAQKRRLETVCQVSNMRGTVPSSFASKLGLPSPCTCEE